MQSVMAPPLALHKEVFFLSKMRTEEGAVGGEEEEEERSEDFPHDFCAKMQKKERKENLSLEMPPSEVTRDGVKEIIERREKKEG